ncbi:MAG: Asp-tRNA(Asn)/Glu-tRNA(Gln) amidotransferase subunit GatA [Christensenellales bacterium]|jgi:aspartyl-tRNA(Asn)/glutamyl-tRNA(Gln) amidotransferase subunit A
MKDIVNMSLKQLSVSLQRREISSVEATRAYLQRIEETDRDIGAFITLCEEDALIQARAADELLAKGEAPPLAGVPFAVKDNICTKGVLTTCASKMLSDFIPPYDATVMKKLKNQSAVMLGKLNMDEFAMGATNETSAFLPVRNPLDKSLVPGGSSGGSGAAVAAGQAAFTLGTDTGGSIRQPAAYCGITGLKPTYGGVSRNGLIALASSFDQIGPMAKTAEDCAMVMNAIAEKDPMDATSRGYEFADFAASIDSGVKGQRIALPEELLGREIDSEIKNAVLKAAKTYEKMGAAVDTVSMPELKYALQAYFVISSAEAASNLARFDSIRFGRRSENCENLEQIYKKSRSEGFGQEVQRRIMLGNHFLSSGYYDVYFKKAQDLRALITRKLEELLDSFDIILSPVTPAPTHALGEKIEPVQSYMSDFCTVPASLAGLPALSMPCGSTKKGIPIGMQLVGRAFSEKTLFKAARAFEEQSETRLKGENHG